VAGEELLGAEQRAAPAGVRRDHEPAVEGHRADGDRAERERVPRRRLCLGRTLGAHGPIVAQLVTGPSVLTEHDVKFVFPDSGGPD
jgi:hypothetical protein